MTPRLALAAALAAAVLGSQAVWAATLSERIFRSLTEIHELREADKNDAALAKTNSLLNRSMSDYERAQTLLLKADLLMLMERYENAVQPLEEALKTGAVPKGRVPQIRSSLGQLYAQIGRYRDAIRLLEEWLRDEAKPPANVYFMLAMAYLETKQIKPARRNVDLARQATRKMTESQYRFAGNIYLQQSDWRALQQLLEEAIRTYPKQAAFWKQLAQVYMERRQDAKALNVLRLAYANRMLTRSEELVQLAQLMRLQDVPWLAGQVLEQGLERKQVKPTDRNWKLLGNAWTAAREYRKAYPALRKAAEMTRKSSDWLQLTRLYAQNAEWKDCAASARSGLQTGPKDPGPFHLLHGICTYEQDDRDGALQSFAKAKQSKSSAAEANGWTQFIESL